MGIVVSEGKDLRWKTSMMLKLPRLKAKQFACLEYLMVRFYIFWERRKNHCIDLNVDMAELKHSPTSFADLSC